MNPTLGRVVHLLLHGSPPSGGALDGFVDSLVQAFENCRAGLGDDVLAERGPRAERFFLDLYEKEIPRLVDTIRQQEPHLTPAAREELVRNVDDLIRKVVVPAYARVAVRFSSRERNDFYLSRESLHGLERLGWCVAGIAIGALVVWAPFIPLWEKWWILPFALGGLVLPDLRKLWALRRYEGELNRLVARADKEITRIDTAYLTSGDALAERAGTADARRAARPVDTITGGSR